MSSPSTTRRPVSGVTTWEVQPAWGAIGTAPRAAVSRARTTVVPIAITRPPDCLVRLTRRAVAGGTSYCSGYGSSPASSDETPQCRVIGAKVTPRATRSVTTAGLNGRAALGISALPGRRPKTVWYASSGHRCPA